MKSSCSIANVESSWIDPNSQEGNQVLGEGISWEQRTLSEILLFIEYLACLVVYLPSHIVQFGLAWENWHAFGRRWRQGGYSSPTCVVSRHFLIAYIRCAQHTDAIFAGTYRISCLDGHVLSTFSVVTPCGVGTHCVSAASCFASWNCRSHNAIAAIVSRISLRVCDTPFILSESLA